MKVPTGGKAHEPYGMIRCDSGADSIVWMREDEAFLCMMRTLWEENIFSGLFVYLYDVHRRTALKNFGAVFSIAG